MPYAGTQARTTHARTQFRERLVSPLFPNKEKSTMPPQKKQIQSIKTSFLLIGLLGYLVECFGITFLERSWTRKVFPEKPVQVFDQIFVAKTLCVFSARCSDTIHGPIIITWIELRKT